MSPEKEQKTVDPPTQISPEEFEYWIASDDNTPVSEHVTDEDIIAEVRERFGTGTKRGGGGRRRRGECCAILD